MLGREELLGSSTGFLKPKFSLGIIYQVFIKPS